MRLYPIQLNLAGRTCVVVGGGRVAERKVSPLRAAGASVRLVSPEATLALQSMAEKCEIELRREAYRPEHLAGAFLVLACTDRREVNAQVTKDAQERHVMVLCADDPDAGDFVSPTQITRGDLTLTVSTGGNSPTLAAVLRERLESEFGPEWGALTEIVGRMREIVKTNPDEAGRRAAVRRVIEDAEVHALLRAGDTLEAEARARECLSSSSE